MKTKIKYPMTINKAGVVILLLGFNILNPYSKGRL